MGAREIFSSFFAETETYFAQLDLETDEFTKKLQNDHQLILPAVQKYRKTGALETILADKLKIVDYDAPSKKQPKVKKMAILKESNDENTDETLVKVKQEKVSLNVETTSSNQSSTTDLLDIKRETDDMPAPNWIPPKKTRTTRATRTKGKKAELTRDSDVIVQDSKISTVNLVDSEESETDAPTASTRTTRTKTRAAMRSEALLQETVETETRSTRTKTIRKAKKNEEIEEKEPEKVEEPQRSTRTKTIRKGKKIEESEQKDGNKATDDVAAASSNGSKANKNSVEKSKRQRSESPSEAPKLDPKKSKSLGKDNDEIKDKPVSKTPAPALDATYVAAIVPKEAKKSPDHPNFNIFDKQTANELFTDDESIEIPKTPPKKEVLKKTTKEVFSPYEKSSLKKKVEAFEKLQNCSSLPVKTTGKVTTPACKIKSSRLQTPSGIKFNPTNSSTSKITRVLTNNHNISSDTSTIKNPGSTQKDPRERHKKLLEKEQALKKKEAILQAQAEAKRKMNEEKQLKAQQQRKALEAEKQKIIEQQKLKEARLKQREKELQEYMQMKKQQNEEKHQAQKNKLKEIRQAQEAMKIKPPVYMITEPPKLPTADCYDSDDPNYKKTKDPIWCNSDYAKLAQLSMMAAGEKIKNTLFCRHAQTPDLTKIFETIDPKKLKRSSSMHWKKPPRYTMMPDLNETRFSEDEELFEDSD